MDSNTPFVLVVEDEPITRIGLVSSLEEAGYTVTEAESGDMGLIEMERDGRLTAVLTDVRMPGTLDGLALARIVRERNPDAAVIVMSGAGRPGADKLPSNARFFHEPYSHPEVISTLKGLLSPKRLPEKGCWTK